MTLRKELLDAEKALAEAPRRIPPIDVSQLENDDENNAAALNFMYNNKNTKPLEITDKGIKLYEDGNQIQGIDEVKKRIVYNVQYVIQNANFINAPWVTQMRVYNNKNSPKTVGLAEHIFYKYIMAINGVVVTDKEQTGAGEKFWKHMIDIAFINNSKYKVYVIDLHKEAVARYKTLADWNKLLKSKDNPWGDEVYHEGIRPAISNFDFK